MVYDPEGLDLEELVAIKERGGSVVEYSKADVMDRDTIVAVDCDIWVPAARPDAIREDNEHLVKAKLIVQGANIPATPEAEARLHERGVLVLPDFIANAGGVICAASDQ